MIYLKLIQRETSKGDYHHQIEFNVTFHGEVSAETCGCIRQLSMLKQNYGRTSLEYPQEGEGGPSSIFFLYWASSEVSHYKNKYMFQGVIFIHFNQDSLTITLTLIFRYLSYAAKNFCGTNPLKHIPHYQIFYC